MFEFLVCFLVCLLVGLLIKSSDADGDNVAMMIMMVVTMNNSNDLVVMICNHGDVSVWDGFKAVGWFQSTEADPKQVYI